MFLFLELLNMFKKQQKIFKDGAVLKDHISTIIMGFSTAYIEPASSGLPEVSTKDEYIDAPVNMFDYNSNVEEGNTFVPSLFGRSYIFSERFYGMAPITKIKVEDSDPEPTTEELPPLTVIEEMVLLILEDKEGEIDKNKLKDLCYATADLSRNQNIYFLPIILLILDTVLMSRSNGYKGL